MRTFIYMVRHGESPKIEGNERTRGLTDKGKLDAHLITELLRDEGIDHFVSSPYRRATLTIEELAQSSGKEVTVLEALREMVFVSDDKIMPDKELYPLVQKLFSDPEYSAPDGESIMTCQNRVIPALKQMLKEYQGQKVVIGTHGVVMTLMMGYYDRQYDLEFLWKTSKPDIYRMEFNKDELVETQRLWKVQL
ncbi:histidine phosphatase family protein [Paenibacillus sp. GCM10027629]|uniref:histidine phosphatase family protein n=1 Tax=Paenibacillus sp. GCM10027629 TaxID=3273414 RepID=UPI003642F2B1